jgi:hypothetical protein
MRLFLLLFWISSHTNQVDTVSVARTIRKVMSQVGTGSRDALSIIQATNVVPNDFFIPKAGPSMANGFFYECVHGPTNGSRKQVCSSYRIVKLDGLFLLVNRFQKVGLFPVASMFGIVTIKVADTVGRFEIAIPSQVLLDGLFGSPMPLLGHDGFFGLEGVLAQIRFARGKKLFEQVALGVGGSSSSSSGLVDQGRRRKGLGTSADSGGEHGPVRDLHNTIVTLFVALSCD